MRTIEDYNCELLIVNGKRDWIGERSSACPSTQEATMGKHYSLPLSNPVYHWHFTIIIFYCSHLNFRFNLSLWKQIEMTPVHVAAAKSTRTVVSRNGFKPVMKTAIYAGSYLELLVFFLPWCCGGLWNFSALTTRRWNIINVVIPIAQYCINDKKLLIINWYITP